MSLDQHQLVGIHVEVLLQHIGRRGLQTGEQLAGTRGRYGQAFPPVPRARDPRQSTSRTDARPRARLPRRMCVSPAGKALYFRSSRLSLVIVHSGVGPACVRAKPHERVSRPVSLHRSVHSSGFMPTEALEAFGNRHRRLVRVGPAARRTATPRRTGAFLTLREDRRKLLLVQRSPRPAAGGPARRGSRGSR